jgi:hypothetical protein
MAAWVHVIYPDADPTSLYVEDPGPSVLHAKDEGASFIQVAYVPEYLDAD